MHTTTTERRRPGRPRKGSDGPAKMKDVHFTLSPQGADLISQLAQRLGMSQSSVVEYAANQLAKAA